MSTPAWVLGIFGAVMLLIAEVSAGQLVIACARARHGIAGADIAVSRLLTGIAMAGILVPALSILPDPAWAAAFAVMTTWFAWCLRRESQGRGAVAVTRGHYAPHLVLSVAMLYLFAALAGPSAAGSGGMPDMPGMPGMAGGSPAGTPTLHAPTVALILALLLIAFTVHDLDRPAGVDGYFDAIGRPLVPADPAGSADLPGPADPAGSALAAAATRLLLSPALVKGCQVATGVTMAFILILMI